MSIHIEMNNEKEVHIHNSHNKNEVISLMRKKMNGEKRKKIK